MLARVQRWGNRQGVRLKQTVLEQVGIAVGDEVDLEVTPETIVIRPRRRRTARVDLATLVARMPKKSRLREVDWGPPVGREVW